MAIDTLLPLIMPLTHVQLISSLRHCGRWRALGRVFPFWEAILTLPKNPAWTPHQGKPPYPSEPYQKGKAEGTGVLV